MIPLIVNSCYAFSDTWGPFVAFWKANWPTCRYPLILVTDKADGAEGWNRVIELRHDWGWCKNLIFALEELGEPSIVMLTQDDFWIINGVAEDTVNVAEQVMMHNPGVACLRLTCNPPATEDCRLTRKVLPGFGEHAKGVMYRVSAAPAFWRTEYLKRLLVRNHCVMDFYLHATDHSCEYPETVIAMFAGQQHAIPFIDSAVRRGKWDANMIELCKKTGIHIDTSRREIE